MKHDHRFKAISEFFSTDTAVLWGLFIAIALVVTLILTPAGIRTNYTYHTGDIAERDIKAPKDFFVEDREATRENQELTKRSIPFVYDYDPGLINQISRRVTQAFKVPHELFEKQEGQDPPTLAMALAVKEKFETILGVSVSKGAYTLLFNHQFNPKVPRLVNAILEEILNNGVVANKEILLKEEDKGIILRTIGSSEEKRVTSLRGFYGPDQARTMVRIVGDPLLKGMNYELSNLIVDLSQRLLLPNITMNKSETEKRISQARSEVKPVLYQIKEGEMVLREGERVTDVKMVKLKALQQQIQENGLLMTRIGAGMLMLFAILTIYLIALKNHPDLQKHHNRDMGFLTTLLILFLGIAKVASPLAGQAETALPVTVSGASIFMLLPLAAGAMTACMFLGFEISRHFALLLSLLACIIFSSRLDVFVFFYLASIAGAYWIRECRERKTFISAGVKLALFSAALAISLNIYRAEDPHFNLLAKDVLLAATGGFLAGIITAGLTPVMEILFMFTTDIKLLELANLDQPLMRRLMVEAPGTYNHSVIVASLAEAAASAIGASTLKARVCAYYHDIGKLNKPLYFIENQTDGKNRHDKLSPSMSALILIQHVKQGVAIAREHKLGSEIKDTIRQHHGTSLIRYFYNKSVKRHGKDAVKTDDFRYPGPKPQTREAGIVMLADVVEAALRTLEKPTSARIQGRVQDLINAIFADGQLEECELTLKDLHQIARSFNKILTGLYHHRIEYTEKPQDSRKDSAKKEAAQNKPARKAAEQQKDTHGKSDPPDGDTRRTGKTDPPDKKRDSGKSEQNLKRLGIQ